MSVNPNFCCEEGALMSVNPNFCCEEGALMSVNPNFCCEETKNRGTYTHVTLMNQKFGTSRKWKGKFANPDVRLLNKVLK